MSFQGLIIVIALCLLISVFYVRGFLYGIIRYQLNNSAYKKRKKQQSFKEWLFYSKYKEEIPKTLRILYYSVLLIHLAGITVCFVFAIIKLPVSVGRIIAITIAIYDAVWILVIALLFWSPGPDYAYERWITKKRGQKRNKK